jgi:hypothetical protein
MPTILEEIRKQLENDAKDISVASARLLLVEDFMRVNFTQQSPRNKKSLQTGPITIGGYLIV